jgi:hypothetical protein
VQFATSMMALERLLESTQNYKHISHTVLSLTCKATLVDASFARRSAMAEDVSSVPSLPPRGLHGRGMGSM